MSSDAIARRHAALIHRLGGAATLLPVPATTDGLLEVGALAGLPCWSGTADAAGTRRLARQLIRRGEVGLLLCDHPNGAVHFVAATVEPVHPIALTVGDEDALPLQRLRRLRLPDGTPSLAAAFACAAALDVDAAGRATFAAVRALLDQATAALPARIPLATRHAWALLQFTRLLFLRFVESEGWLDGRPDFLATRFDECLAAGRHPERHFLAPLFFGTLNRPSTSRSRLARSFGRIPFLNGGLFESHPFERHAAMRLPTEIWRMAVEQLVLRTEVTLAHRDVDGRVTPEMLGRVFEGVMAPDERKRDGAFFTPPAMVTALVREAVAARLAALTGVTAARLLERLDDPDPLLQRRLLGLTVLDPAVGSGAFLVGALDVLHGPGPRDRRRVEHLVTRRLYGVDRNPAAVRLAELRLWLEILRAMRGHGVERVAPLPNLHATIRAGDALLDPELPPLGTTLVRRLRDAQRGVERVHGPEKRERLRALQRAEAAAYRDALAEREASLDRGIRDLLGAHRAPTLFGDTTPMRREGRLELARLHAAHREVRRERRRLAEGRAAPPFTLGTAFAPVLHGRGGFDLVIGNPPWVRAERLPAATRAALTTRYRWWRATGSRGFRHLPDLSVAFLERSLDLLAPTGTLAFLLPAKVATAGYAATARSALAARATLHLVADLADDPRADFDATTYPLGLVASRGAPARDHAVRLELAPTASRRPQAAWQGGGPWLLATPDAHAVAERLFRTVAPLAAHHAPQLGVKTGANEAFLDPPEALRPWSRLAVRGRDVRAFTVAPTHRLLWPADSRGEPWARLPGAVAHHLERHAARLRRRSDLGDGPWWRLFRVRAATAPHRIVWGDLARRLEAASLEDPEAIPLNSCYVIAARDALEARALVRWLNSTPIRALARLVAEPAAGGAARFGARAVGMVPWLPAFVPQAASLADAADDQAIIDALVADLLALDARDRAALAPLAARRR